MKNLEEIAAEYGMQVKPIEGEINRAPNAHDLLVRFARRTRLPFLRRFANLGTQADLVDQYTEASYLAGDTIWLGLFCPGDEELRTVSFFHELGHGIDHRMHTSSRNAFRYDVELRAWELGLVVAHEEGYRFEKRTLVWADKQLASYDGYEEREYLDWRGDSPERDPNMLQKTWATIAHPRKPMRPKR